MVGIYRIYNLTTGQSYIGQSKDIMKRINEHFYHRTASNSSPIDNAINQLGIQCFAFQIIELCDPKDLDWKEEFYINQFRSNIYGYNIIDGGQHNNGDSNPNKKLSSNDVYNIREAYNSHIDPNFVYKSHYIGIVSLTTFFAIWEGKVWQNIHMDVYTEANKEYYRGLINSQDKERTDFSDEDIMRFRNRYVNETAEDIYNSEKLSCKFNTFKAILTGSSYKHLPIYVKKKKTWVYNC